ncbi:MAG: flagellar protein FlaR [Ktedonobacterales bacterium]|nr:flagellar protein FlaR [Ktedonobacterales bacterium]
MTRVAVIGNAGGGKSTMARALAAAHQLPYHEVDVFQWWPGWVPAPEDDVRAHIKEILRQDAWVLDGFGPWDTIEERFERADTVILVDHPLWVHYWWAAERQIACATGERVGGPEGCPLAPMTERLFELMWTIHHEVRPKLLELVERQRGAKTIYEIQSPEVLNRFVAEHCSARER